jgi:hypothetical protein
VSSEPVDGALAVVRAMAAALSPHARAALARALRLQLGEQPTISQQRVTDLGTLARMLDERAAADGHIEPRLRSTAPDRWLLDPYPVDRVHYDAHRPPRAPSSSLIVKRFGGSWRRACRAIWGLQPDGRYDGIGQPWDNAVRGNPRIRYTDDECRHAVRRCAQRFGRVPTTSLYIRWTRLEKARARESGAALPRLPDYESLRRRYGGWAQTLSAAAPLFGTIHARSTQQPATGPQPELGGPVLLDGERLRTIRQDRGIADGALRKAAGCPLSTWRALVARRVAAEPAVVQVLCRTLGVTAGELTLPA